MKKRLVGFLCVLCMFFILTSCQPVFSETLSTSKEWLAQIGETVGTQGTEALLEGNEDITVVPPTFDIKLEPDEEPTCYPEGEIPAELIMVSGVLYVFDESKPEGWSLPKGSNMIGQVKSVVTTEEPKRDFEAAHVELKTEIYWNINYLEYIFVKRPSSDRYERFVQIREKEKWWTEEVLEEIAYIIEPMGEAYYMSVDRLVRDGNDFVLTGDQYHEGSLCLSWYQKEKLDAGAVLNVFYAGELRLKVTSRIRTIGGLKFVYKIVEFSRDEIIGESGGWFVNPVTSESWVEEPPFSGIAYKIVGDSGRSYKIPLMREYQKVLSGDVLIETISGSQRGETMTLEAFYEMKNLSEDGSIGGDFKIFEENGEVVRIMEIYTP